MTRAKRTTYEHPRVSPVFFQVGEYVRSKGHGVGCIIAMRPKSKFPVEVSFYASGYILRVKCGSDYLEKWDATRPILPDDHEPLPVKA